jgi:hypothetical protein
LSCFQCLPSPDHSLLFIAAHDCLTRARQFGDTKPRLTTPRSDSHPLSAPLAPFITLPLDRILDGSWSTAYSNVEPIAILLSPRAKGKNVLHLLTLSALLVTTHLSEARSNPFPAFSRLLCNIRSRTSPHRICSPPRVRCIASIPLHKIASATFSRNVQLSKGGTLGQHDQKAVLKSCHAALHGRIVTRIAVLLGGWKDGFMPNTPHWQRGISQPASYHLTTFSLSPAAEADLRLR